MYGRPRNDIEYSRRRFEQIMSRRRLCFNPYTVSDRRLLEIATTTGWGNLTDIAQITTLTFTRLRLVSDAGKFDGIYIRVADSPEEIFLYNGMLIYPVTALDSLQPVRSRIGKVPIRSQDDLERMVGKRYFVSRLIPAKAISGRGRCAYQMYRLKGNVAKDAELIRQVMCEAKVEMLERLLKYVESEVWLDCNRGLFEYEPRVRNAIDVIRHFPDTPVPEDF